MSRHKKKMQSDRNIPALNKGGGQLPQNPQSAQPAGTPVQAAGSEAAGAPPHEGAGPDISTPDISKTYFFIFWGLIVTAVALACALEVLMPNVHEFVIERWIMLALAGILGLLLLIYK